MIKPYRFKTIKVYELWEGMIIHGEDFRGRIHKIKYNCSNPNKENNISLVFKNNGGEKTYTWSKYLGINDDIKIVNEFI